MYWVGIYCIRVKYLCVVVYTNGVNYIQEFDGSTNQKQTFGPVKQRLVKHCFRMGGIRSRADLFTVNTIANVFTCLFSCGVARFVIPNNESGEVIQHTENAVPTFIRQSPKKSKSTISQQNEFLSLACNYLSNEENRQDSDLDQL
ncbi:Hypothetical protein CINCED_3A006352 [Cinara cedri]|uniref:Uncharacterized protein n=1 Tax=Cinara cedri TaxID=506608 RepID=A0A5E4NHP2_9HEMI|nr:Hypothetical protein CINCED_3A006352 [Cinara cedri]